MENLIIINWLKDSKYRIPILELLNKKPYLPSELAKTLNINRSSVSRILNGLKKKNLVKNIKGETRTSTYIITIKGKDILIKIR